MEISFWASMLILLGQLCVVSTIDDGTSIDDEESPFEPGEDGLVQIGMRDVIAAQPNITLGLQEHRGYAAEFGTFAHNALYLAMLYMDENLKQVDDAYTSRIWRFAGWISDEKNTGLFMYDEEAPAYVVPGADPGTEDLRGVFALVEQRSAVVSDDPRCERRTLSNLFGRHLQDLAEVSTKNAMTRYGDELLRKARSLNALFRLTFRRPSEIQFTDAERESVVGHINDTVAHLRKRVAEDGFPPEVAELVLETIKRIVSWQKRLQGHAEL